MSSADQRAESGGVDERNLSEGDDDGAAGVRQPEQPVTQSGHGSNVDLSGHADDRDPARLVPDSHGQRAAAHRLSPSFIRPPPQAPDGPVSVSGPRPGTTRLLAWLASRLTSGKELPAASVTHLPS